jgi:hypothetical protein
MYAASKPPFNNPQNIAMHHQLDWMEFDEKNTVGGQPPYLLDYNK